MPLNSDSATALLVGMVLRKREDQFTGQTLAELRARSLEKETLRQQETPPTHSELHGSVGYMGEVVSYMSCGVHVACERIVSLGRHIMVREAAVIVVTGHTTTKAKGT